MSDATPHTTADVRERVKGAWATVEAAALAQANLLDSHYGGQPAKAAEIRNAVEQVAALLRTPRGEGEASGLDECITCMNCGQDFDPDDDAQARYHEAACEVVDHEPTRVEIARRLRGAAHRSEAQGDVEALAAEIISELRRAREKFPDNNVMTLALVEEVGELAKATFEESRDRVRREAIQVAVMAMRVVLDGDRTLDAWRESKGLDPLVVPPAGEKEVGMASEQKAYRVDAYGEAGVYFAETPAKAKYRAYRGARCAGFEPAFADFRVRRAPEYDHLPEVDGKMLWYAEMIRNRTAHPDRSESDATRRGERGGA